jgi:hypothetical protein
VWLKISVKYVLYKDFINEHEGFHKEINQKVQEGSKMNLWYVVFKHFFLSYYFFEFANFFFQNTYNTRLNERYNDDPSTHSDLDLDLWLEIRSYMDLIDIGCTVSLTLRPRTCRWLIVFQPLNARNQFQAL